MTISDDINRYDKPQNNYHTGFPWRGGDNFALWRHIELE